MDQFFCEMSFISGAPTATNAAGSSSCSNSSPRAPIELTTELTDMEDGTYDLTYTVPVEGQYELAVKLFDSHIKGSPFKVMPVSSSGIKILPMYNRKLYL